MTNNPFKMTTLQALSMDIVECLPLFVPPTDDNRNYMRTKAQRMQHNLPPVLIDAAHACKRKLEY